MKWFMELLLPLILISWVISSSCSFAPRHQTVRLDLSLSQKNLLFTQYNSLASEIEEKLEKLEAEKDELERKVKCDREVVRAHVET